MSKSKSKAMEDENRSVCYWDERPSECKDLKWSQVKPTKCVHCIDKNILEFSRDIHHSSEFEFDLKAYETKFDTDSLYAVPLFTVISFLMIHILQSSKGSSSVFDWIFLVGDGFLLRYVIGLIINYMLLTTFSLMYFSHKPMVEEVIEGSKKEYNAINDMLLVAVFTGFITVYLEAFSPGIPTEGVGFLFLLTIHFTAACLLVWERLAISSMMSFSDVCLLLIMSFIGGLVALGFYKYFYNSLISYYNQTAATANMNYDVIVWIGVFLYVSMFYGLAYFVEEKSKKLDEVIIISTKT